MHCAAAETQNTTTQSQAVTAASDDIANLVLVLALPSEEEHVFAGMQVTAIESGAQAKGSIPSRTCPGECYSLRLCGLQDRDAEAILAARQACRANTGKQQEPV